MEKDPFFYIPKNSEWNACIGIQGDPTFYAEGYIEAALELARQIVHQKLYAQRDTLVMPILYNARHAIELHLKLFIDNLVDFGILQIGHRANHDISSHFAHLTNAQIPDLAFRNLLEKLKPSVDSLSRIDDDGQEFRYFENRGGDQSLQDKALANIVVIGHNLEKLKSILNDLKYRTWTLCDEYVTETHTKRLSRKDLFEITALLPPRLDWSDPSFDDAKGAIKKQFGLSNKQFSIAIDKIQEPRELKAALGVETPLVHLSDEKAILLAEQWRIIHPPRKESELGFDYCDPKRFEKMFENQEQEKDARGKITVEFAANEFADAKTIFYLARNNQFSEYYERELEEKIRAFKVRNDIDLEIRDLMQKTNFLAMFEIGARMLGRLALADQLSKI